LNFARYFGSHGCLNCLILDFNNDFSFSKILFCILFNLISHLDGGLLWP